MRTLYDNFEPDRCTATTVTGHGAGERCIWPKDVRHDWHRGARWPHGKALEWRTEATRDVDANLPPSVDTAGVELLERIAANVETKRANLWAAGCDNGTAVPLSKPWDSAVLAVCDTLDDVAAYVRSLLPPAV